MLWEELTGDDFAEAVVDCGGVCIFSLGVLERHGPHMPLGTDALNGHEMARLAAEREPAIVLPTWYIGQINEARCFAGSIALPPKLLVELLLAMFDEIGRNGLTKIIVHTPHGGNIHLARFLAQCQPYEPKGYQTYVYRRKLSEAQRARVLEVLDTPPAHAGESECSLVMAHRPDLVRLDVLKGRTGPRLGRMDHVRDGLNAWWWYADYPDNYCGDAKAATAEKGKVLLGIYADVMADYIKAVKNDRVTAELAGEFFRREEQLRQQRPDSRE